MRINWDCEVCNGNKMAIMRKEDCGDYLMIEVSILAVAVYRKQGYHVVSVFCAHCGLLYHNDSI